MHEGCTILPLDRQIPDYTHDLKPSTVNASGISIAFVNLFNEFDLHRFVRGLTFIGSSRSSILDLVLIIRHRAVFSLLPRY